MAVNTFLSELLSEGIRLGYFQLDTIGKIDKSCCPACQTEVIDFDQVEEKLRKEKALKSLKSCDCLKIISTHERIDFIEMKGVKNMIKHMRQPGTPAAVKNEIKKKIEDFNFLAKIHDSYILLNIFLAHQKVAFSVDSRRNFIATKKHFILLTDVDPSENAIEFIALNFQFLATYSTTIETQIQRLFIEALDKSHTELNMEFEKPVLLNCNETDAYYAAL